jgi:isoleucyl-tRNA synthetase
LAQWPEGGEVDGQLLSQMKYTRELVTFALEARTASKIKVRQPILSVSGPKLDEALQGVVLDEVNAKKYIVTSSGIDGVHIDTTITPELKAEGDVREFIRGVQERRKIEGLSPSDRVVLLVQASDGGQALLTAFKTEIVKVVGADDIVFGDATGAELTAGDHSFTIELQKK